MAGKLYLMKRYKNISVTWYYILLPSRPKGYLTGIREIMCVPDNYYHTGPIHILVYYMHICTLTHNYAILKEKLHSRIQ